MSKNLKCLFPTDTAQKAAAQMKDEDVGSILICEPESGKLLGIVTDRDIAVKDVAQGMGPEIALEKIASWNPTCCREDDDLDKAVNLMTEHQVRRLPVIDDNGRLVGIISQGDVATRAKEPKITAEVVEEISKPPSPQYQDDHAA